MTKEEMKNRISMALKDPILQQGFECICKENAELQDKLNNLASVAEVRLANWQKYEKELKSEKEYSATLRKEIDEYTNSHTLCAKFNELKEQNNKAKEIMRSLYYIIQGRIDYENNIGIADEMWRAKQFLKECE